MTKQELILKLYKIGLIKFGTFTFKSGIVSPNYLDHRILVSYPKILKRIALSYIPILEKLQFDRLAAVPYTAMPITGAISLLGGIPWIYTRKQAKGYGTDKLVEGVWHKGDKVVLIDDVITNGESKFEVIKPLADLDLMVKDIVVFIDREQGGKEELKKRGLHLHSVLTLTDCFDVLYKKGILNKQDYKINLDSLRKNRKPSRV